jgi:hypothetical protein
MAGSLHHSSLWLGVAAQDYLAFRTQRSRWAEGAVQIVKKHWRQFLPGTSQLVRDQKREFIFGWLSWFGAEIIAVAAAILNLIWVPFVAFQVVAIPDTLLTLPILAAFHRLDTLSPRTGCVLQFRISKCLAQC